MRGGGAYTSSCQSIMRFGVCPVCILRGLAANKLFLGSLMQGMDSMGDKQGSLPRNQRLRGLI